MLKRLLLLLPIVMFLFLAPSDPASAAPALLEAGLDEALSKADTEEKIPVLILLDRQVSGRELRALAGGLPKALRRYEVSTTLKATAATAQAPVLEALATAKSAGKADSIRPLWISNVVAARLTKDAIAALRDVAGVRALRLSFQAITLATLDGGHDARALGPVAIGRLVP